MLIEISELEKFVINSQNGVAPVRKVREDNSNSSNCTF